MKKNLTKRVHGNDYNSVMNDTELLNKPLVTKEFADRVASIRQQYGSLTAYFAGRHRLRAANEASRGRGGVPSKLQLDPRHRGGQGGLVTP